MSTPDPPPSPAPKKEKYGKGKLDKSEKQDVKKEKTTLPEDDSTKK